MEKLFGLENVLVNVYEKLVFADQLSLAQVNSSFKIIFANLIVPVKYRKLKIRKLYWKMEDEFIVSNDKDEDCMLLTQDKITNLLNYGADYVDEFHAIGENYRKISDAVYSGNIQNLTCLRYKNVYLTDKSLLLIAENCPKLRELRLIDCWNAENNYSPIIVQSVSFSTLEKMMELKILEIKSVKQIRNIDFEIENYIHHHIDMSFFCELITKVPLECLKLNVCLQLDVQGNLNERIIHHNLKELEIVLDCETLNHLDRLGVCKTLLKLNVDLYDALYIESSLRTLSNACENLECLTFGSYTNFEDTMDFQIPPNLKELSFSDCRGLRHKLLKDALSKFKIEQFRCNHRRGIKGLLSIDCKVSPHIRVLDWEDVNTSQLLSFLSDNNTLKELHWYQHDRILSGDTHDRESLKICRNLETLVIHSGYVPLGDIFALKHLKKLQIFKMRQNDLSYIISLFQHMSLKELYIRNIHHQQLQSPIPGFPSTITLVNIDLDILDSLLDFWLDMLQQNPKMSIRCTKILVEYRDLPTHLNRLVCHANFPKDIREMKICGFNLNCKDLRENFMPTLEPLMEIWKHNVLRTIVLSR